MSRIETIPKDVIEKITNELSPADFVNFCSNNYSICNSNEVYFRRMQKDFPFLIEYYPDINKNAKNIYLNTFTNISQVAEKSVQEVLNHFSGLSKYLKKSFTKDLYSFFFDNTRELLKTSLAWYVTAKQAKDWEYWKLISFLSKTINNSFKLSMLMPLGLANTEAIMRIYQMVENFITKNFRTIK